jgi:glycosyltransferase involved in cell wall biosynthesis
MGNKVVILLATYNGGKFIKEQLNSIVKQSYSNWELFISDDGSTDNTLFVINEYCKNDNRIHVVNENLIKQGACQNFGNLLNTVLDKEWDFVMFADQDDFWREDKISQTLDSMIAGRNYRKKPKLVYTDFEYADGELNPLPRETDNNVSGWKEANLNRLLAQNNIYGCTMMINRSLAEKASPIPVSAENHDYWICMVASLLGNIVHVKKRTMLYRQHSNNVSGHYSNNSIKKRFQRYWMRNTRLDQIMLGRFKMAEELNNRFYKEISDANHKLLYQYSNLLKMNGVERVFFCLKNSVKKDSIFQNLAFYYLLVRIKNYKI